MKKALSYILNIFIIFIALLIYGAVQELYIIPKSVPQSAINQRAPWLILATIVVIAVFWWVYKLQLKRTNPHGFDQKPHFSWKRFGFSLLAFIILIAWQVISSIMMKNTTPENQAELNEIIKNSNWLFNLMIVVVAPIFEEIIFRGFLLNTFFFKDTRANKILAILIGGFLFAFMHEPKISIYLLVYWGMGIVMTWVYVYTKDLRYSMMVHILNNSLSLL